ncbi:VPS10 domain-containing receptor SorCS2 [Phyllostomus discolor]|uniref:VPS10 domain-containing receptor SorCS2 n=1 Tax=Phyllostomus discolor TaxID=89673 RepID=A0A7E6D547_9CHIR|nr:VPS10 domain-containing receptor SorCS2 [Phyllostomus discolor]
MAPRGPPRAPKGPGPAARAPNAGAPPPPRSRPFLLLLLLLLLPLLPVAGGAAGRSSKPELRGPIARLTRSLPASSLAGRALPRGGENGPERGAEPGARGLAPAPAPGPGEDGAPAAGQGRWARAASVAGAASPALTSSSFVLKGDATHNQAMVHWTGENSSVILILTKYYHVESEKVLESSLWRSSDYGTTYTKLTLQPGFTTIVDSFFISPANKRKIILVSPSLSDGRQSLFLSTDEGSSFRKQVIPFSAEKLIFHPKEEDKVLVTTKDSKLYVTCDMGRSWLLLQERVLNEQVFWAASGADGEADVVHLQAHALGGGFRYLTYHVRNCSQKAPTSPFSGPVDRNSLFVENDYIFFTATSSNRTTFYVSYRHSEFVPMKLPKYALPKDLLVVSTDENQVFVAVQEWHQTDTYNLYQSDPRGVAYALVLEDIRSSRRPDTEAIIDILEVHGVKGVFLANQKRDGKVVTLITYNKGRDWEHLRPPSVDMNGKPTNCRPPDCHLHLHLLWPDNPYVSGTVHTKDTAPGLIMGAGNLGSQLVENREEMYVTSDCGKTWRQVFEEEHHILYLDHGGVIVAVKDSSIPLKILKFSMDDGHTWSTYNFSSTPMFVDGLLSEPGEETLVITIFGHMSYRSEWELVKVDFRPSFSRTCGEGDYGSWELTDLQGARCLMGQRRSFRKRKAESLCINGRNFTSALASRVCPCQDSDFHCDYGFERAPFSECLANFWFHPLSPPDDCVLGRTYTSSLGYRKAVSNTCEGGVDLQRGPEQLPCPLTPPRGLRVRVRGEVAAVRPWEDVLFEVHQEQGDVLTTVYHVDLGDGVRAVYSNLTLTKEPIRHAYESPGVYRVSVRAENLAGHDEAVLFVQVTARLKALYLEVVPAIGTNQDVNLTAVLLPLNPNFTVFYWWIGQSLQPLMSLNNSVTTRFADPGDVRVTVQAACGTSVLQDSKVIRVLARFQVLPLQFSQGLDAYNPNTPEWREEVGQLVTQLLAKETGVAEELLLTVVRPGLPTVADLYVLPPPPKQSLTWDQMLAPVRQALGAQKVSFLLRAGVPVVVAVRETDTGPLQLAESSTYWVAAVLLVTGGSALGAFLLYKCRRKRPGRTVYAQMHSDKEQEMTSPMNHSQGVPGASQGAGFTDDDLDSQTLGSRSGVVLSVGSREMHSYLVS